MIFPANLSTGTKHTAISTNHLADINITKRNYNQRKNNTYKPKANIIQDDDAQFWWVKLRH